MKKIGLIDVDSHNFPNLALMKLSAWHKQQGDSVEWYEPLLGGHYDRVYMSKIFSFTPDYEYPINADEIIRGGTGYNIQLVDGKEIYTKDKELPYSIEHIYPDYSIYGITDTAYGYMTRGCPRGCDFCIVGKKEGKKAYTVAPLEEFWNGQKNIKLLDPNPIAVWQDNEIIEGHGRLLAVMEMNDVETVPIIRLDNLTDDQRKAYTLVHNKLTMNTDFNLDLLGLELDDIADIDMSEFGFDVESYDFDIEDEEDDEEEDDDDDDDTKNRLKYNVFENQERKQFFTTNYYGIPDMEPTQTFGDKFLRFQDWSEIEDCSDYIVHFYYDDFKFMQAWRNPDKYVERLKRFKAVIAPDFSLYTDFPRVLQILSCYRRQWCGAYWQSLGIDVIPDVVWGDKESYNYCFDGIPKNSVVAVSSVGVTLDNDWNGKDDDMFRDGYNEMLNRLEPTKILFYGTLIDDLEGDIIRIPSFYEEKRAMLDERKEMKRNG